MDPALTIFLGLGVILVLAAVAGVIARWLKQPLIPAYILLGVFLIPILDFLGPGIIASTNVLAFMKPMEHIGVALLLFIVGLELDFKKLKDIGSVATLGTLLQFSLAFVAGYIAGLALGFPSMTGIYFGLIAAFSSTMVVIKLLSDKRELETLHGRIVIGILLMQDVLAVIAISILKSMGADGATNIALSLFEGVILILAAYILTKFIFPKLFNKAAHSQEFLLILSLAICFAFSILFEFAGFSIAIGAFVAGVSLANLPYSHEISGKIKSLKDFFLLLFFVSIGSQFVFTDIMAIIPIFIVLFLIIVILKPLIILLITSMFGFKKRTSAMASMSLGQVSEFSLILVGLGVSAGHIDTSVSSLTILLALATIAATSYFVKFEESIYSAFSNFFGLFEKASFKKKELMFMKAEPSHDVVLIGADRMGYSIIRALQNQNKDFMVLDFNPDLIKRLMREGVHCIYGDIGDEEIREMLKLDGVSLVISTIPDMHENILLLKSIKERNNEATVILTANFTDDALQLYEEGADYVIVPHYLGGEHLSILLEEESLDIDQLVNTKLHHIRDLRIRRNIHNKHK